MIDMAKLILDDGREIEVYVVREECKGMDDNMLYFSDCSGYIVERIYEFEYRCTSCYEKHIRSITDSRNALQKLRDRFSNNKTEYYKHKNKWDSEME